MDRAWFQRLMRNYDELLSSFAFCFNLRHYSAVAQLSAKMQAQPPVTDVTALSWWLPDFLPLSVRPTTFLFSLFCSFFLCGYLPTSVRPTSWKSSALNKVTGTLLGRGSER